MTPTSKNLITSLLLFFVIAVCLGQEQSTDSTTISEKDEKKVDFQVMPYISYNRNLKFMAGAIPMIMYRIDQEDTVSPKSLSGLSAVYTTNESYFIAFFNQLYFKEDLWRAQLFAVHGNYNSQFYLQDLTSGAFYDYGTITTILSAGVRRKIKNKLYAGFTYTYSHYDTEYADDIQPESITSTNAIEVNGLYDDRNSVYYPTHGNKTQIRLISYPTWFGNDVKANRILTTHNKYFSMKNGRDVFAARFSGNFALGQIPFEQQQTVGGKDIRGYTDGKYRGEGLMALQGEYRLNFQNRMGVVGFAGLATIYGSENEDFDWKAYPGIGVGYRYKAFESVNFNIGLDAAIGKDDWGIYFRIGEAF